MDAGSTTLEMPRKEIPLRAIRLAWDDVTKIFERLDRLVKEQGEREIAALKPVAGQSEQQFLDKMAAARAEAFRVTVTVAGTDKTSLFGDGPELFQSPNLPDHVETVYMTNVTSYQAFTKLRPTNAFELLLDFSKPPLVDTRNFVSAPTPNASNLVVEGARDSWIASVTDAVVGITVKRRVGFAWLHLGYVYDIGLFLFGIPMGLLACWRLAPLLEAHIPSQNAFLFGSMYLYVVLLAANFYRIFFGYAKWAFPTVELASERSATHKHRGFWLAVATSLVATAIWGMVS